MIDRDRVNKILDVLDSLSNESAYTQINSNGTMEVMVYPKNWWSGAVQWSPERRHEVLSLCTPLVGKLTKSEDSGRIGYKGEVEGLSVRLNCVDRCKILGYKTVTKTVKKEIERPEPEYEEVEETEQVAITDCDIKQGKFKEEDIEVPA